MTIQSPRESVPDLIKGGIAVPPPRTWFGFQSGDLGGSGAFQEHTLFAAVVGDG